MPVLTMTRIIGDVDTVAMMEYTEAESKPKYLWRYMQETYGADNVVVYKMVKSAFKAAAESFDGDHAKGNVTRHSRFINPMHSC